jgi:ASC-1-like (ASCH) protein
MIGAGTLMLVLVAFFCYLNGVIIPLYEDKWSCRFPWVLLHGMNNICMYMLYIGIVKIWSLSDELYEKANLVLTWNPLPPNELVLHVQEPWFSAIRAGTKTVEGRKGGATKFERYCGRPITFVNGNASVTKRVYRLLYYPGLQSFLAANPNALPGVTDRNKQLEIYHQFYSDDDIAKAGGFTAIEWE